MTLLGNAVLQVTLLVDGTESREVGPEGVENGRKGHIYVRKGQGRGGGTVLQGDENGPVKGIVGGELVRLRPGDTRRGVGVVVIVTFLKVFAMGLVLEMVLGKTFIPVLKVLVGIQKGFLGAIIVKEAVVPVITSGEDAAAGLLVINVLVSVPVHESQVMAKIVDVFSIPKVIGTLIASRRDEGRVKKGGLVIDVGRVFSLARRAPPVVNCVDGVIDVREDGLLPEGRLSVSSARGGNREISFLTVSMRQAVPPLRKGDLIRCFTNVADVHVFRY